MIGSVGATLLGFLLQILFDWTTGQQLLLARPQRSLYEAPLEHLEHLEHLAPVPALPPLGWNTVGGGLGLGVGGEWAYNPVGLGHMSKDDLLTLLEAWKEVEQESATTTTTAAPRPVETTTRRPVRPLPPLPPPPPAPPRPIPIPIPLPVPAPGPQLPSGTPITVRLPAFVPIRLAAMWTPPAGGAGAGAAAGGAAATAGDEDLDTDDAPDDDATPRLFRFMPMPIARARPQAQPQARQQTVVRNTLDSVDVGTAPVRTQVRPEVQPKIAVPAAPPGPKPAPFFRPKSGLPPHLANARFELVPSSQIIGDWRE
ncbi:vegetative cell wall protein gp1 [Drosophila serrata]|uniref:vegetative cell wall protein gp1 n=1 Tax=Drosophila serrata TaxID=7274 RepID=UPI000A1D2BDE|nr:vegetative cell wall protein gp1 [Drosophila serrata]XP_020802831.1 vegetative cell wall protein gp1 [Drosophila serrata]XP_020802832.1 vegetative cell wall protein gp1 [Drosophila serrata]